MATKRKSDRVPDEPRILTLGGPGRHSGAAFHLNQPAADSVTASLAGGWTAELIAGSGQIVLRSLAPIDNYGNALDGGLAAAQEALDLLTMQGRSHLVLEASDARHIVWWTEPRGTVLRAVTTSDIAISMSVTTTVRDASGAVVPPQPTQPLMWHPSFRYFRLSQATSDLFDAYRNMYLALEAALSTVVPPCPQANGTPEKEGAWLRRALRQINGQGSLAAFAPPGASDVVDAIYQDLYGGTRTGLFHAKSGRPVLLPHSGANRGQVVQSLECLSRLYLAICAQYLHVSRPSGAITYAGFDAMTGFAADVVVSDDPAPALKEDMVINPTGGAMAALPTRLAPELSAPGHKFWLGEQHSTSLVGQMALMRRIGLRRDFLLSVDRLDDPLSLEGVDIFQVQSGLRMVNLQQPRFMFNT